MSIRLGDHFSYRKLLRFTLPSIFMMIFSSIYGVIDGFFVSNFVGKTPFAAVNFIMPLLMMLATIGFMLGTGGSALVAKTMGEGDSKKANEYFSLFVYFSFAVGIVITVLGIILLPNIARLIGAEGEMLENAVTYGRIILAALPFFILQLEFHSFFATAEKPQLGLVMTVVSGVGNIVLDVLLVAVFRFGLVGAAIATAASQLIGGLIPLVYFSRRNTSLLRLTRARFDGAALVKACSNGSSELMSNASASLVSMLYNAQLLQYAGEDGVAAYGVLMYVTLVFNAAFIGYSIGSAPIVSYHFGAKNHSELRGLLKKTMTIILCFAVCMFIAAEVLAMPLARLFVGYDAELLALTQRGFLIYSFSFLFAGFAIVFSGFFTALNDGFTSALISFMRTLIFQVFAVMLLPLLWGVDGIWLSIAVAEALAALVGIWMLLTNRKKYHYM